MVGAVGVKLTARANFNASTAGEIEGSSVSAWGRDQREIGRGN